MLNMPRRWIGPALALFLFTAPAGAGDASDWSSATGGAVRLIGGGTKDGVLRAGLEIRLEPGWKTYWRNPGDSGVPPVFDWSQSDNVAAVSVDWPVPRRFDDADGVSIGYKGDTVLPLKVTRKDATRPATLVLALDYATCKEICVPAKGSARLGLDPQAPAGEAAAALDAAEQALPRPRPVGGQGSPAITAVELDAAAKPPHVVIDVRAGPDAELFVDGPPGWFLPVPTAAAGRSVRRFTLPLDGKPKAAQLSGAELQMTLADGSGAVQTSYTLP